MSQYFAPIQRSVDVVPTIFNTSFFNKKNYQTVVGVVKQPVPINEAVGIVLSPNEAVEIYNGLVQVGIIDSEPIIEEEYKPLEEVVITLENVAPEDIKADAELDALVAAEESSKILVIYDEDITLDVEELEP